MTPAAQEKRNPCWFCLLMHCRGLNIPGSLRYIHSHRGEAMFRGLSAALLCTWYAAGAPAEIRIAVIEGDGAINRIDLGQARAPIVKVLDRAGRPVKGAAVTFVVPRTGPGGQFGDGESTLTVTTGGDGLARGSGLRPNRTEGQFEVRVTASHRGSTATTRLVQTNAAPLEETRFLTPRRTVILATAAAAAAVVAIAIATGGDNAARATPFSNRPEGNRIPGSVRPALQR